MTVDNALHVSPSPVRSLSIWTFSIKLLEIVVENVHWFVSYLSNGFQFVTIRGKSSKSENITYGVPKGSVLGPVLFLFYIYDLHLHLT